jgi:hypothetical protein
MNMWKFWTVLKILNIAENSEQILNITENSEQILNIIFLLKSKNHKTTLTTSYTTRTIFTYKSKTHFIFFLNWFGGCKWTWETIQHYT